jgi:hypothetical protein
MKYFCNGASIRLYFLPNSSFLIENKMQAGDSTLTE